MASRIFAATARNLALVRQRLGQPLTLSDKVLLGHLSDPDRQEMTPGESYLSLLPDRVVFQDVLGQTGMLQFMQTQRKRVAVPTTIHCDHLVQARAGGEKDLFASLSENREVYDFLRSAAARYGAGFWEPGAGIIHQVVLENYAFPGQLIIGTDSHTPNAGGLGACAIGVGGADAVEVIAGLPWELLYPRHICVYLTGRLNVWTSPKDVILWVAGRVGVAGATNSIVEYIGPGARTISATGKATITNMGAELGATTSMFPADEHMDRYLAATGRAAFIPVVDQYRNLLVPDEEVEARPERYYDRVIELDLSSLEPQVGGPHSPGRVRPISELAAEIRDPKNAFCDEISTVLIGSCTDSSYEDVSRAANVAAQAKAHNLRSAAAFLVTPGSEQVRRKVERDGQLRMLEDIGGVVLAAACGPCIGQWRRADPAEAPNTIVSSYNRNFAGRNDGQSATMHFLVSPEIATAMALAGRSSFNPLTDYLAGADGVRFRLEPPPPAPELPANGSDHTRFAYTAPPDDGTLVTVLIHPGSERLQPLTPWSPWDGNDFLDLPVLLKARGKTTTDQISPAGPWLRYRGHLDRFSDNMFLGAVNAFTGETGRGRNVVNGIGGQPFAAIARDYRARGMRWVAIGDDNYGEGSSREHAALSPRLLGGAAIIARSFARIHESNLKKQGLLALTFEDPGDYDRIGDYDRVTLCGPSQMSPRRAVECILRPADGMTESLRLKHSYSLHQLEWFRAGSALNLVRESRPEDPNL
jgi:aconitate hydratase